MSAAREPPMSTHVTIATFRYRHEAEFARATLEAAGVPSVLLADDAGGTYAGLSLTSQPRLIVSAEDEEAAREVLADMEDADVADVKEAEQE